MSSPASSPATRAVTAPPEGAPGDGSGVRDRGRRLLTVLGSLQGYIGLVAVVIFGIVSQGSVFLSQTNLTNAIGAFASRGILAVGETLVILTAGIDLSVGSVLGLGSMVAALLLIHHGWSALAIVPICMLAGAGVGFLNGAGTTWLRVQSFVMTLAMLNIVRGINKEISNDTVQNVQSFGKHGQLSAASSAFAKLGTPGHNVFTGVPLPIVGRQGIYFPVLALVVVVIIFQLVLSKTRFGRHVYAVGGNPTAARLSGVNVTAVIIGVFVLAGMLAGFAGTIDAAYSASADPLAGQSFELDAIAAAVIGGTSLAGGRGSVVGTLVGSLILTLLDNILGLGGVSDNTQLIIKGLIVVAAVVIQRPGWATGLVSGARRMITAGTSRNAPPGAPGASSPPAASSGPGAPGDAAAQTPGGTAPPEDPPGPDGPESQGR
jgi:ribose transport system permease protein